MGSLAGQFLATIQARFKPIAAKPCPGGNSLLMGHLSGVCFLKAIKMVETHR
jgi:hypothetical protein